VSDPAAPPRRGFVYWVRTPDEPGGKRRPALVVSPDVRNRLANDVIVVPVSSVIRDAPTHVRLRAREGGLQSSPSPSASRSLPSVATASPPRRSGEPCLPRAWSRSRRRFFGRSACRCRDAGVLSHRAAACGSWPPARAPRHPAGLLSHRDKKGHASIDEAHSCGRGQSRHAAGPRGRE